MYIKYITYGLPGDTHLIEEIKDVRVHGNLYLAKPDNLPIGDDAFDIKNHYLLDGDPFKKMPQETHPNVPVPEPVFGCKMVDFTRKEDGVRCRLAVYGRAYICNDNGQTVQTIDPNY